MNCAFDADLDEDGYLYIAGYTFNHENNTAFVICLDENGFENEDYGDKGYALTQTHLMLKCWKMVKSLWLVL